MPVGATQVLRLGSVFGTIALTIADPSIVEGVVDQDARTVTLLGKAPGSTTATVRDDRGMTVNIPVRAAYNAGTIAPSATIRITGDPASPAFVKRQAVALARALAQARPGAQIVASEDEIDVTHALAQDDIATVAVPVLIQGDQYFSVTGTTSVSVENVAAPRISPDSLMVSDFPETLTENGVLFAADVNRERPSRFLYYHYDPPGQPDRRIVLRAENPGDEPALVQFINGRGGPVKNEMEAGHDATAHFLVNLAQNQGRLIEIPAHAALNLSVQDLPAQTTVSSIFQLRVLDGASVHLTLFAQNASDDADAPISNEELLTSTVRHARGIYAIAEFHYARQWSVTDEYLELNVGQIPLPNRLKGEALAGDYGVLQSFVVTMTNPTSSPQQIAIYENPHGGRATGTYLIDGTVIQSHQVPAFSRYKVRQYVVPAHGFERVTIVTMPEGGSSYPLKLVFAPDDGSVAPNTPGSPIY